MNSLKNFANKGMKKIKKNTKKADYLIEVKLVKLTVKPTAQLPDLMYRLEWKRGPDTYASKLIDIKAGNENPENDISESFSKLSSFHTLDKDSEISEDTVWEKKICNFLIKRQDELNQVTIAQIECDMSSLVNSENQSQAINEFKLEDGYDGIELRVEWTITKSNVEKVAHNHSHKIDEDDDDDSLATLNSLSTLRSSIVGGKYTDDQVNEYIEHIASLEKQIETLDGSIDQQIDNKQGLERKLKDEKNVNKYLNKEIIDAVKDSQQIKSEISFLGTLLEKLDGQKKIDKNQISQIKELVSKQKKELGDVLATNGFAQEQQEFEESDDEDNEMSNILKHDKKIAELKRELAALEIADQENEIDDF